MTAAEMSAARRLLLPAAVVLAAVAAWWLIAGRAVDELPPARLERPAREVPPLADLPVASSSGPDAARLAAPAEAAPAEAAVVQPAASPATEGPLEVEVVLADGQPAGGAPLVLARGETVLARGVTDRRGMATLGGADDAATLYVAGVGTTVHVEPLERPRGRQRVVLAGETIAGTLTLNGAPPGPRVVALGLWLTSASRSADDALPDAVVEALKGPPGEWGERFGVNVQRVSEDGGFAFAELEAGETYTLDLPEAWLFADRQRRITVTTPSPPLRLDLIETPSVRGRAVHADSHLPIAGCSVRCSAEYDASRPTYEVKPPPAPRTDGKHVATLSSTSMSKTVAADAEGRFRVVLERPVSAMTLDLLDVATGARSDLTVEGVDAETGKDLGDVPVRRARSVRFRVVDPGSAPIAGAFAILKDERELRSRPTGSDGLGELRGVPEGDVELSFVAAGFDAERRTVTGRDDALVDVQLSACAQLEVQVSAASGSLPDGLLLHLAAEGQAFSGDEEFGPEPLRRELGSSHWSNMSVTTLKNGAVTVLSGEIRYVVPPDGLVLISCLKSGTTLRLSLAGAGDVHSPAEQAVVLAPGETRRIELQLTAGS